ncbi:tail fiber domain-containing protein [Streptococcus pneumoniae]|nr:tail fiber domain-containing protein [Streptococcus pneumoniae]MDG9291371.1 tail fiber domain-containing protein [Streptococcus pneumoniae]
MDALTRRQFDRAMFAKERTLAIRVGEYASRDIKEASFEYGYIKGDTYKPGGTCAGSGKITFTSIITTFNKLDTLHPEIGLLVGDTYQWVKMGEYFINDIEIDRNRNTTTLELMDGMFKLNREYVTDLHFPAEVREVIQEICLKTGIELANDYFGISAMRYHIEQVPEGKKLSFRDMLSAMTQMIGMSCFFNREGKMEIRDLTESNITINADSYFLHGLTKSEIEYQIAGITCKTDKKSLTVGMKTGRSLELDNVFMTQSALNDLYYKLKNLTYYPYNLNYQGHLLLEVGQWVTIQTNKKETFKVPVLSQSFTFKGGLRGRISADSKAGNDTQYSYEGTITKHIKQQDDIEAKIQAQIEAADKDFDQKVDKIKKDFNDQVELAKARAEEVKRELSDTINQRFNSFDNGPLKETKRKAEEALRNAGASTLLAQEAKRIGLDSVARLEAFKSQTTSAQTALSGDLDALKRTIANDIRPKQAQAEAEIAKQAEALVQTKKELAGASTLLAQEAKRIELDSVARLEAFKSQTTSAQTALSGDLDVLKRTIANDIRPKQAQAEAEIAKQVEALSRTKNELAGVKSAQATYKETTTRRLSELTNLANGKASKSELTQTAEELSSKIASVQVGGINLLRNTASLLIGDRSKGCWMSSSGGNGRAISVEVLAPPQKMIKNMIRVIENTNGGNKDLTQLVRLRIGEKYTISCYARVASDSPNANVNLLFRSWANDTDLNRKFQKSISHKNWQKYSFTFTADAIENSIQFGQSGAGIIEICAPKIESGTLATDYSEAPEDIEGQISTVESTFKQRADSLDAGVRSLTEGLRTKADISSLNVTAENIRQSVKSLETDTQNKLNQKLSQAEFEVRAGSIRQEILNATKDKASKSELTQTAEELASRIASVQASGRNLFLNSLFKQDIPKTGIWTTSTYTAAIDSESKYLGHKALKIIGLNPSGRDGGNPKVTYPALGQFGKVIPGSTTNQDVTISFYAKANKNGIMLRSRLGNIGYKTGNVTLSTEIKRYVVHIPKGWTNESKQTTNEWLFNFNQEGTVWIWMPKFEISDVDTSYSEAPEDIEGQISTVESTFKQRANSLEAGVNRLTEGLRTKVDISALNVTAENIRQSVKSLETDTQNKLNQKLSQAEFEVRASGIRQEILNATKDKADKTLVTAEAGKLREELTSLSVGENLFVNSDFKNLRDNGQRYTANGKTYQNMIAPYWYNPYNAGIPNAQNIQHGYFDTETFSDTVFAFNESDGSRHWKALSTDFKIGVISAGEYYFSADLYATDLGTHIKFGFYYHNSTGKLNFYAGRTKIEVTEKGRWTRLGIDLKVNDDIDLTKKVQFYIYGYNFASNSILYLKKPKVSKGRLKSDWSPALEDTEGLITEAKATFERTAQGLRTDLSAIQEYVNKDGQRQEALQRYTREESTRQATAVRELVNRDFVGKATYQEDVKGINQRIEAVKTSANKDIASQIASYRQSVDGKFTDISSQITTYKQDVGGQISGLSNRLTSSEQGTTTQISNLSNRINSNKQGTDNQISNLKTQVATNKDNAERQMGRISDQVSANKANADSQFANVTNQLARKVETTDFQRVKETSKLYERILGNTENGIADKVARMALTNQLFQVEVGKVAKGGRNYIRNGQFKNGSKNWLEYQSVNFGLNFNYQHSQNPNNRNRPGLHFYHDSQDVANFFGIQQSFAFDGVRGEKVSVSLLVSKDGGDSNSGLKVALHYIKNKNIIGQEWQNIPSPQITSKYKRFTFTFTLSDDVENLNLMLFGEKGKTINLYVTDVQLERGSVATDYKEAPEDTDEAIRSVQSQLTGSWAVQNINSAGAIISGINLGANGHNRFVGKLTHITGETLIDRAVIKSAMVDKLKTANFEAGSVTTTILDAEAVTAEKLKVDNALIRKLTANDAFIDQLISKRIFSTKVESVISSSTFLEAYQGRIGGFTLGQFDQGGGRWISGVNQFSVGMGNGAGYGVRTAFWANWGNNWNYAGPKAWNVNTDGKMYCRNEVGFYDQVDFSNSSRANFYGNTTFSRSPVFSNGIELGSKDVLGDGWNPKGGRNAVVWWNQVGSGSVKYWMEQKSDRRLKENITDTAVKALDKINRLRMVAFDFIENKKHEEIGLIAQEAETIVPRIVSRDPENPDGYLHIDYTALVPYLIKAIQELNQKIEKMEKTIA